MHRLMGLICFYEVALRPAYWARIYLPASVLSKPGGVLTHCRLYRVSHTPMGRKHPRVQRSSAAEGQTNKQTNKASGNFASTQAGSL